MGVEIRAARPDDYAEAGRVTALAYGEFMREDGSWDEYRDRLADVERRAGHTLVLVAEEGGRIVGTTTLELEHRTPGGHPREPLRPEEAHMRMLGVLPEARRRGVGRLLVQACIEQARAAGKTTLTLNTTDEMEAARTMYESMGFRRGEDLVWPDGFRLLSYALPLDR